MKIRTNRSNKKRKLIILLALLVAILAATGWYIYSSSLEKTNETEERKDSDQQEKKNANKSDTNDESDKNSNLEDTNTEMGDSGANTDNSTDVTTPPTPPELSSPYPVTNERFQIRQVSTTNFEITLYPVINNPAYSDYNAQLRAYKQEALDYLKSRHGSIEGFGIDWSPADAKDL